MSFSDQFYNDAWFLEAIRSHIAKCGNMADDQTKDQARLLSILDRYLLSLNRPK